MRRRVGRLALRARKGRTARAKCDARHLGRIERRQVDAREHVVEANGQLVPAAPHPHVVHRAHKDGPASAELVRANAEELIRSAAEQPSQHAQHVGRRQVELIEQHDALRLDGGSERATLEGEDDLSTGHVEGRAVRAEEVVDGEGA